MKKKILNKQNVVYAVDFESYYDDECSVSTLSYQGYFTHPLFNAYLVSVVSEDFTYVGAPEKFDWAILNGCTVISHNAAFDEGLYLFGVSKGWYPACNIAAWHCSADMVSYLGLPRSLKEAAATVLNLELTKTVRDNMKGKTWAALTPDLKQEVIDYAEADARTCLALWEALSPSWPIHEREISALNRRITQRGLPLNVSKLEHSLSHLKTLLFESEQTIPWIEEATPLSRKAFNAQCRVQGIVPPASLAQDNPDTELWFAEHSETCGWARAVSDYRRINMLLKKFESLEQGTSADGRYYGNLLYCGANPTARFTGKGGNLNLQNLPREEMFGTNLRATIEARKGYKLIVADYSQIEVRTLCFNANDAKALELIRKSKDIYHAFAVLFGLHDPSNGELKDYDAELRRKVKGITLGCGFGMGAAKFAATAGVGYDEALESVNLYRQRLPTVPKHWRNLDSDLAAACAVGAPFEITLPSGRVMRYGRISKKRDVRGKFRYVGKIYRGGRQCDFPLWGGTLAENCAQAVARDILVDTLLRVEDAGLRTILHVHDEIVCEVEEKDAEKAMQKILKIMSTPPKWIPDIPLSAEAHICTHYQK